LAEYGINSNKLNPDDPDDNIYSIPFRNAQSAEKHAGRNQTKQE